MCALWGNLIPFKIRGPSAYVLKKLRFLRTWICHMVTRRVPLPRKGWLTLVCWTPSCRVASAPSWKHSATTGVIHWECCCLTRAVSRNHWQELGCWYYSVLLCSDCSIVASACPWKVSSTSWHLQPCCRHSGKAEVVPDFAKQCKGIWAHLCHNHWNKISGAG